MNTLGTQLGLLAATTAILALPPVAIAAPVIPPDNSAVTQYTEAFPTVGGDKESAKKPKKKGDRSPTNVLGSHKARKLAAQGAQGQAVAEVVAATAPTTSVAPTPGQAGGDAGGRDDRGNGASGGGSNRTGGPAAHPVDEVDGSSGLGEVISQATGSSSSGQMGALLPLAIVAAIASSLIFLLRKRRATGSRS